MYIPSVHEVRRAKALFRGRRQKAPARTAGPGRRRRTVEITRRGEPVAVVLSVAAYRRTLARPDAFRQALRAWQSRWTDADREVADDFFDSLRDGTTGRDVDL